MAVKTFTTNEVLTAADTNTYLANAGLVYIGGVSFSADANPYVNGCFSSTYQNYRILITAYGSAVSVIRMRMRSGTNTVENGAVYDRYGFSFGTTAISELSSNQTSGYLADVVNTTSSRTIVSMDIFNPNDACHTTTNPQAWGSQSGSVFFMPLRIETTTQYTGIEIYPDSGTLTGSMRVFGYRQA